MLEVARECFEDAGVMNWKGRTIGCYIGTFEEDWIEMYAQEAQQWGLHRMAGTGDFVLSNRLSYEFDINRPSMTIRTACSSSLVALNEACAALGRGDCEAALVGGVNLILGPGMTTAMSEQGVLSKDGRCKSFSAEADGYARGEAVTAIYIKPLADALRDGNPVRAVIRATSHNSDGRTPGMSQPSTDSHERLIRRAYAFAGISDFRETAMVECHGTGTQTGDPIEAKAVARVFGEKGVYIGSVKPNLGHTEGASGLVSLIKMVKALEHRTIPPNINFKTPNPDIPFKEAKLVVPLEPIPWPKDRLERVSLNSFGVGGANAHVILESAASHGATTKIHETPEIPQLLLFTANTTHSLGRLIEQYKAWVDTHSEKLADLAYTLARRREYLRHRAFAIVKNGTIENVSPATDVKLLDKPPNVVMVFTGQGELAIDGKEGCMAAIGMGLEETERYLIPNVNIASLGPEYWVKNLESPVRFREAVGVILNHEVGKNAVFLEVGPHSALAGPLRQILTQSSSPAPYVSAMMRGQDSMTSFLTAVGKLHSLNVTVDLTALFPIGSCLPDLPRYPWHHEESYWYEARVSKERRQRKFPSHDLLGVKTPESSELEPVFRNLFHLSNVPWMRDHRLGDDVVFPFAGYIALAGEAIMQITGIEEGFSVRNISVSTALVLGERHPTEMVSTFRPHRLTNSTNSAWWDFTVTSYNGHTWIKHCFGEVAPMSEQPAPAEDTKTLPRKLSVRKWYGTMRQKGGMNLGLCFQTLGSIETSTRTENRAIGQISNGRQGDEGNYHIHPTVLDGTIQILGAAAINGRARDFKTWLPTGMDRLSVWRCAADMVTDVSATLSSNHSIVGGGRCTSNGVVVVEASGIKLSLAAGTLASHAADTHAAARYEWAPDIDFMNLADLIRLPEDHAGGLNLLDELGQLCMLSSEQRICETELVHEQPHLQRYLAEIKARARSVVIPVEPLFDSLDDETILAKIDALVFRLAGTPAALVAIAIQQVHNNMILLLSGQPLSDVISDKVLTNLHEFVTQRGRHSFIRHLSHSRPNLRILELGTMDSSSPSKDIVSALMHANGQVLCSQYTFASPGYIPTEDQEQAFVNLDVMTLDIREDPQNQGLAGNQYDLIVASGALRASNNVQQSLGYLKKLLSPNDRLLLQELCSSSQWLTYVFGLQPEWWLGDEESGSDDELLTDFKKWKSHLAAASLNNIDVKVVDAEEQPPLTTTLVAGHSRPETGFSKKITALCEEPGPIAAQILSRLEIDGYEVIICGLDDQPPAAQDVVSLLDTENSFFAEGLTEARFQSFKAFLEKLDSSEIIWVTHSCELGCDDPRYAQVLGLSRVIRTEQLADMATCQVDNFENSQSLDKLIRVIARYRARQGNECLTPDYEWAINAGQVHVGRFHSFPLLDELLESEPAARAQLDVVHPGRLNTLHWVQQPRGELKAGEVEVQVHAAGLNFRDILVALGIVELPIRQFGLEAAGYITRVALDVDPQELKVGDRVFCLKKQAYSTYLTTPTAFCVRIPDQLSFEDAGAMLMPYVTALHSLVNVARLERGQSVLVHSA
ncbi:hypothetical protein LTR08_008931 [Meristemomyces frigidus]|nr:hypothetical protein LTR08_008931 [Meristemomyces frigidus]